jgi:hypothetical protein
LPEEIRRSLPASRAKGLVATLGKLLSPLEKDGQESLGDTRLDGLSALAMKLCLQTARLF